MQAPRSPRNITPPNEEAPRYPYRRVWLSLGLEQSVLFVLAMIAVLLGNRLSVSPFQTNIVTIIIALMPVGLWLIFSWFPERFVEQPRKDLLKIVIIAGLAANAIGFPLLDQLLAVDQWIGVGSNANRILAATVTVAIVPEILKYYVVRNFAWGSLFRKWDDSVAYGLAAGIGYSTVLALQYVVTQSPALDIAMIRVFGIVTLQMIGSVIVAYGMSETRFSRPIPVFMASILGIAALMVAITRTLRSSFVTPALTLDVSYPRNIIGVVFSGLMVLVFALIMAFLFSSTERIAKESEKSREIQ